MKTRVDDRLRAEARRFRFRFACEDCVHAGGTAASLRCSLGYPAAPRLSALEILEEGEELQKGVMLEEGAKLEEETEFESCKSFELGP